MTECVASGPTPTGGAKSDGRRVLYPHRGRRQWMASAVTAAVLVGPAVLMLVLGAPNRSAARQGAVVGLVLTVAALLFHQFGRRVVLEGTGMRAPHGVRWEASEIATVGAAWSAQRRHIVRVESITGDVRYIDLGSAAANRDAEAVIGGWATGHGGNRGVVNSVPLAEGTVLRSGLQGPLLVLALIVVSWGACALRMGSGFPPGQVAAVGVLSLFGLVGWLRLRYGAGVFPQHARVQADRIEFNRLVPYVEVLAATLVDVEEVWDGLWVHRTSGPPVHIPVMTGERHGRCGSLVAWAKQQGGARPGMVPRPLSKANRVGADIVKVSVGAAAVPGWWALFPALWAVPLMVAALTVVLRPLLTDPDDDDSPSASRGR